MKYKILLCSASPSDINVPSDTSDGLHTQIKMIREVEGKNVLTDYSVKYDDKYVLIDSKWLIKDRIAHFLIIESRNLS